MSHKIKSSNPPPLMPGQKLVKTTRSVTDGNGRRYSVVNLEREPYSDASYKIKRKNNAA